MFLVPALLVGTTAFLGAAPPAPPSPGVDILSTVFYEGLGGISCFRIPSVVQTTKGTLVAFAEARFGSCSDGAVHELATRRSTDSGKTWSKISNAVGGANYFVGNPDAVATASGKVVLIYVKHSAKCEGDCGIGNAMVVSTDDGVTFGPPVDLSKDFGVAAGSLPGPGVALQTKSGRLLVVSHHSAYQFDYVTLSDDEGKSWKTIPQAFPKMDEAQITQLTNGSLLLNMRHAAAKEKGRGLSLSLDNGNTWGPIIFDKNLASPVCQASTVTFGGVTYFSNPANSIGRFNTTVKASTDNAETWSKGLLIQAAGSAGYSCLVKGVLADAAGKGGILFESANMTIQFASFPLTQPAATAAAAAAY